MNISKISHDVQNVRKPHTYLSLTKEHPSMKKHIKSKFTLMSAHPGVRVV